MKALGITRIIDKVGRVNIPKEILRSLNIPDGDNTPFSITQEDEKIVIEKAKYFDKGIIRQIDDLGRITIPIEIEKRLDMSRHKGSYIEFFMDQEKIVLKKYEPGCIFCSSVCNLRVYYKGKKVCGECLSEMIKSVGM